MRTCICVSACVLTCRYTVGMIWYAHLMKIGTTLNCVKFIGRLHICRALDIYCRCRYEHFFHFAIAHLLLYGLVKDFWKIWTRSPDRHERGPGKKQPRKSALHGNPFLLPPKIRKQIVEKTTQVQWTKQMKKRSADILGCDCGGTL